VGFDSQTYGTLNYHFPWKKKV